MTRRSAAAAAVAALMLAGWAAASAQTKDQVYGAKGLPLRGRITSISPTEIVVDVGDSIRKRPVNDVAKVTFAEDPLELRRARDEAIRGRWEDARRDLAKVRLDDVTRTEVKQDILYYQAYCAAKLALTSGGDKTAAARLLQDFILQYGDSHHYYEAVETFGDLAFSVGRYDTAAGYYKLLADAPWPDYKVRSALAEARALQAEGKYQEALEKYQSVLAAGSDTSQSADRKQLAVIGQAVCLANTGKQKEAIKLLEELIADNDPSNSAMFAQIYNGLGACYLAADQTKDALLAYLHVDLLFFSDPDAHAEALYHLSKLWIDVNQPNRAVRARELLSSRYPHSIWAQKPQKTIEAGPAVK